MKKPAVGCPQLEKWHEYFGTPESVREAHRRIYDDYAKTTGTSKADPLLKRWADSVHRGKPDYSVYAHEDYAPNSIYSFVKYSRQYVNLISKLACVKKAESILDVGNGPGFSTALLQKKLPRKFICGTNFPDSAQWDFGVNQLENYMVDLDWESGPRPNYVHAARHFDILFASEYFEHFEKPYEHLRYLLGKVTPNAVICANTFSNFALGHFHHYDMGPYGIIDGKKCGRVWSKIMREAGYEKLKTGFWNDRPQVWIQKEKDLNPLL